MQFYFMRTWRQKTNTISDLINYFSKIRGTMICYKQFGMILMDRLKTVYENCSDIKYFGSRMFSLWKSLPGNIQDIEPFWTLSYADDPLSWGDEEQTRNIYEYMLDYYKD